MDIEDDRIPPGCLRVTLHKTPEAHIIALDGELDIATVGRLDAAVAMVMRQPPPVLVIDLRKLSFFGGTGVTSLLDAYRQCRALECRLFLVRGGPFIQRIFAICEVDGVFEFVHRPEEAAPSLGFSLAQQVHSSAPHDAFD
jgi:anti-anti-sigma factor